MKEIKLFKKQIEAFKYLQDDKTMRFYMVVVLGAVNLGWATYG